MKQRVSGFSMKSVMRNGAKACLLAAVALALGVGGYDPAQATTGVGPYVVPQVLDVDADSSNGIETYIVAVEATVDIGDGNGAVTKVMAFKSCSDAGLTTCTTAAIPGPEFRLKVGDRVIVHYVNKLPVSGLTPEANVSAIHWHGIELNNTSDGTEVTQAAVIPDGTFEYDFIVTRPGIFWYHPHHHAATNQVAKGLYGSIIVEDPNEAALIANNVIPANDAAHTRTLMISDITVCNPGNNPTTYAEGLPHVSGLSSTGFNKWQFNYENHPLTQSPSILCDSDPLDANGDPAVAFGVGDVPNIQEPGPHGRMSEGFTVLTNGVNAGARAGKPAAPGDLDPAAQTLNVEAGQGLRLQIVNPSPVRYLRLRLTTAAGKKLPLFRIGGEGGLLDRAVVEGGVTAAGFNTKYNRGEILIPPAGRADVVAKIPVLSPQNSVLTLWTEDFQRVAATYSWTPTVPVMHLLVNGNATTKYGISNGKKLLASLGSAAKVKVLGASTANLITPTAEGGDGGTTDTDVKFTFEPLTGGFQASIDGIPMPRDFTGLGVDGLQSSGNPFYLASARHVALSNTVELTVTNKTGAHHPFHLHGFSFQPTKLTPKAGTIGPKYVFPREFRDIVDVPAFHSLTFRVSLDERSDFGALAGGGVGGGDGRWLFHCHILPHATFGMMSELHVH